MKEPKYKIGDKVWILGWKEVSKKTVYGVFPLAQIFRSLPRGLIADEDMTEEDFKTFKLIPVDKRQIASKIIGFKYLIAKDEIDIHLLCARLAEQKTDAEIYNALYALTDEKDLFPTKQDLINSL